MCQMPMGQKQSWTITLNHSVLLSRGPNSRPPLTKLKPALYQTSNIHHHHRVLSNCLCYTYNCQDRLPLHTHKHPVLSVSQSAPPACQPVPGPGPWVCTPIERGSGEREPDRTVTLTYSRPVMWLIYTEVRMTMLLSKSQL